LYEDRGDDTTNIKRQPTELPGVRLTASDLMRGSAELDKEKEDRKPIEENVLTEALEGAELEVKPLKRNHSLPNLFRLATATSSLCLVSLARLVSDHIPDSALYFVVRC